MKNKRGALNGMTVMFVVMLIGIGVVFLWDNVPAIKESAHSLLDPSVGKLLAWNLNFGFLIVVLFFSIITILAQKYLSDQDTLKTLKEEMKLVQDEMKLYRQNPQKTAELTSKSFELTMKTMPITMKPAIYTTIPFLLTFKWFSDFFIINPVKVFGMHWILAYFVITLLLTAVLKKMLKVH